MGYKENDAAVLWFKGAINSIAQRMAKTLLNYGHSESNRVKIELLSARKWQAITFVNQFIFFSVNCQSMFQILIKKENDAGVWFGEGF